MALPVIQQPIFEVYLKSLNKNIRFRPFLVKEEKILLIAKESEDDAAIFNAIKQIITNCCVDDIDVASLPMFDIEMFFVHLRMKSVGEKVALNFKCEKKLEDSDEICGLVNDYELDLGSIQYDITENHKDVIMLSDTIGVKMKYPVLDSIAENILENSLNDSIKFVSNYVDYVFDSDQIYDHSQFTKEDLEKFLGNLTTDQLGNILQFFVTSPKVVLKETTKCKKCNNDHLVYAENLYSFFI